MIVATAKMPEDGRGRRQGLPEEQNTMSGLSMADGGPGPHSLKKGLKYDFFQTTM